MRWLAFFILAYVAVGLQIGLGGYLRLWGAGPNLVLIAVVFVALHAPREPALLGCLILGLMQDLATAEPFGLYGLCYALVGLMIVSMQEMVHRNHTLTHVAMALAGGVVCAVVVLTNGWIWSAREVSDPRAHVRPGVTAGEMVVTILYTAVVCPFAMMLLQKVRRYFASPAVHART